MAGDLAAGKRLSETLRPFVPALPDYTAFAGLREMKALIDAEVARKDLSEHPRRGPGGIREIEFTVQLLQLIRGGREPRCANAACCRLWPPGERLGVGRPHPRPAPARGPTDFCAAWRTAGADAARCADARPAGRCAAAPAGPRGLGFADLAAFETTLWRSAAVSEEFARLLAPVGETTRVADDSAVLALWRRLTRTATRGRGRPGAARVLGSARLRATPCFGLRVPALRSLTPRTRESF